MKIATNRSLDPDVLNHARRQLDTASRRLFAISQDREDTSHRNRQRLSEALANIHAALARLEDTAPPAPAQEAQ